MNHTNHTDIKHGQATIPWDRAFHVWRLPSGEATTSKLKAINMAKRIDRVMTGRAKADKGV